MKKSLLMVLGLVTLVLVACQNKNTSQTTEEYKRDYESEYLEAHRINAQDYANIYDQDLYIDNKLLEDLYDHIIKTTRFEEKLIEYTVSEYDYGDFEDSYEIITHFNEETEFLDSNVYDSQGGVKTVETIIRGDTIFQRSDETGIKDDTSFVKDVYDPNYFYILGLDTKLDDNFTRMIYFMDEAEIEKISRQGGATQYKISVTDMDGFKAYLLNDVNDDFIQFVSSLNLTGLKGVDVIYEEDSNSGSLSMVVYMEDGEYTLTKKVSRDKDLHYRNMENINPEQKDLKE